MDLISKYVKKDFDRAKIRQILEQGPEAHKNLEQSLQNFISVSKSNIRKNNLNQSINCDSPLKRGNSTGFGVNYTNPNTQEIAHL